MRIDSEDRQSVVILVPIRAELSAYPSLCFSVELKSKKVSGVTREVWIALEKLNGFLRALESLDTTRKTEAYLEGVSPGKISIRIFPLDSRGHIALEIRLNEIFWISGKRMGCGCYTTFELDPTALSNIKTELTALVEEARRQIV
jgi:hypothetical protein